MKKRLLIVGAGGHGRVCADIAEAMDVYSDIYFADDAIPTLLPHYPIVGNVDFAVQNFAGSDVFIAIGNNATREKLTKRFKCAGAKIATLIHPSMVSGCGVTIGEGTVVMPGVVINNNASIGEGVILNTACSVDHDCEIANYCHVSVGAHLAGAVQLGCCTWIGAGSTVINNLSICSACMVGAGSVVVRNIDLPGTYFGVPARRKKEA